MIPWWWLIPAFTAGACLGLFTLALLRAAKD